MKLENIDNNNTIYELPYEKFFKRGPQALTDLELLAILLQTGVKGKNVLDLSEEILKKSQIYGRGIAGLHAISLQELLDIEGIGKVKGIKIKAICELAIRMASVENQRNISYNSPASIASYYMESMCHELIEQVRVLAFDNKMHFISDKLLTLGTANASLISAREIFSWALKMHSIYIVILHNHPSGEPTPSKEDSIITEKLFHAGKLIGIELADHIIIGNHCYFSYREKQQNPFC